MCPEPVTNGVQTSAQIQKAEKELKANKDVDEWLTEDHYTEDE